MSEPMADCSDLRWFVEGTQHLDAAQQAAAEGDIIKACLHAGMAKSALALAEHTAHHARAAVRAAGEGDT